MPYKIYKVGVQYCVHKENPDGSRGKKIACHATRAKALAQQRALYANEKKEGNEMDMEEKAVWTTAYKNDLPDSAFLYIKPGCGTKDSEGKTKPRSCRKFPVKDKNGNYDLAHVRNAIARIPQASGIPADPNFDPLSIDDDTKDFLDEIYSVFGQFSAIRLMDVAHSDQCWIDAGIGKKISHQSMKECLKKYLKNG